MKYHSKAGSVLNVLSSTCFCFPVIRGFLLSSNYPMRWISVERMSVEYYFSIRTLKARWKTSLDLLKELIRTG